MMGLELYLWFVFSIGIAAQEPMFAKVEYTLRDEEVLSKLLIYSSFPTNQLTNHDAQLQ